MKFEPVYTAKFTDERIRDEFFRAKYREKHCDFCDSKDVYFVDEEAKSLRCRDCWKRSSLTHGTYLESTKLSLRFWYEVIWSFLLDHSTAKTRKLLKANNRQKVSRIYRTLREALAKLSETRLVDNASKGNGKRQHNNIVEEVKAFLDSSSEKNHPLYLVYELEDGFYLKLLKKPKEMVKGVKRSPGHDFSSINRTPIGFGCLFHGKGEYASGSPNTQLEGLWSFTKTRMQIYRGIRQENWKHYLKEIEFKYNHREQPYEIQAKELIDVLMKKQ